MLHRIRKAMEERDKGFTMVELLVVIIIIGILAAISIPKFLEQRKKAVDSGVQSDLSNAALSVENWITTNPQSAIPNVGLSRGSDADYTAPASADVVASVLKGFVPSNGNTIVVTPGTEVGTYTICGWNPNADQASGDKAYFLYDSANGGLQQGVDTTGPACDLPTAAGSHN